MTSILKLTSIGKPFFAKMEDHPEEKKDNEEVDLSNMGNNEILKLIYGEIREIRLDNVNLRQKFNKLKYDTGKEIVSIKSKQDDLEKSHDIVAAISESRKKMMEGLLNNHSKLEGCIVNLEAASKAIRNETEKVNIAVNDQENRNRKWCVEINDVPTTKEENCYQIVERIGSIMNIDIAHINRQNPNANTPPTLIVLFKSRSSRDHFFYNKSKLHTKSIADIGLHPSPITDSTKHKIYINESLSATTKLVFRHARVKCKSLSYYSCYTVNGLIFAQKEKDGSKVRINSMQDINLIT